MEIGKQYSLEPDDIKSTGMGQSGVDVLLSPAAKRVIDLAIECKNHESLNVCKVFWDHFNKYLKEPSLKLLVHSKNRSEPLVTLRWEDFTSLLLKATANARN